MPGCFMEYHKLRTRKSATSGGSAVMVPKHMTVEACHGLSHQITARIGILLHHSHILVHIEPCPRECASCAGGKQVTIP